MIKLFLLLLSLILFNAPGVYAKQGVGVGTGKIVVDEELKPGLIYDLPDLVVLNTGDEKGTYKLGVSYKTSQEELQIPEQWIEFSEKEFMLEPGETKVIKMKVNIPLKTEPGDYFSYVGASVRAETSEGETSVGIAAASKLYFTIAPASIFQGVYYRSISLWKENLPWTNIIGGAVLIFATLKLFGRYFRIRIDSNKKEQKDGLDKDE